MKPNLDSSNCILVQDVKDVTNDHMTMGSSTQQPTEGKRISHFQRSELLSHNCVCMMMITCPMLSTCFEDPLSIFSRQICTRLPPTFSFSVIRCETYQLVNVFTAPITILSLAFPWVSGKEQGSALDCCVAFFADCTVSYSYWRLWDSSLNTLLSH